MLPFPDPDNLLVGTCAGCGALWKKRLDASPSTRRDAALKALGLLYLAASAIWVIGCPPAISRRA